MLTINIPEWCVIGSIIEWSEPEITGFNWVKETIHSYGVDGFFHSAHNCPMYYTKFEEFGKTVRLPDCENKKGGGANGKRNRTPRKRGTTGAVCVGEDASGEMART